MNSSISYPAAMEVASKCSMVGKRRYVYCMYMCNNHRALTCPESIRRLQSGYGLCQNVVLFLFLP